ncbi:uncharacterized protein [Montipora capricornis]|uniref:uncharacterized protein isoform X2 n=1 Tax=Montipora capricornis TaxID=246305 RepID=UPI0035F16D95
MLCFILLNSCGAKNAVVSVLVGDDDSSTISKVYASNAKKLHVAPLGSSQANEALNNTIGSKAPKIRHYGSSESNDFRVACAVGQKNLGHSYVSQAFIKTQLSPGSNSLKFAKKMDKRILSLKEKQKTREYKTRRIEKKENCLKKTKQLENREGQQYSSGMGFDGDHAAQTWLVKIRRDASKDFKLTKRTKICSLHFKDSDFRLTLKGRRYIKDDALPSIFPWSVSSPNRKSPRKRQNVVEMPSSCPTMDNLATNENNKGDCQDKEIADLRAQIAALQDENLILQETNKDLTKSLD